MAFANSNNNIRFFKSEGIWRYTPASEPDHSEVFANTSLETIHNLLNLIEALPALFDPEIKQALYVELNKIRKGERNAIGYAVDLDETFVPLTPPLSQIDQRFPLTPPLSQQQLINGYSPGFSGYLPMMPLPPQSFNARRPTLGGVVANIVNFLVRDLGQTQAYETSALGAITEGELEVTLVTTVALIGAVDNGPRVVEIYESLNYKDKFLVIYTTQQPRWASPNGRIAGTPIPAGSSAASRYAFDELSKAAKEIMTYILSGDLPNTAAAAA